MEKYIYDNNNGLWYELQGDYYIPCLVLDEEDSHPIGKWGRKYLWYGNSEPAECDISPSKEYKELLQLISRNEDKLLATMTDAQKELFTKYADCVREHQVMAENLLFQNSFRLGARIMLEVMRD